MITIHIPWPPKVLSPNKRTYWRAKNPVKSAYRDLCYSITLSKHKVAHCGLFRATFVFHPPSKHHRDLDNALASAKSGIDGVCSALGINDKQLRPITLDWGKQITGGLIEIKLEPYEIDIIT